MEGAEVEKGGLSASIFSDKKSEKDFRGIYPELLSKESLTQH